MKFVITTILSILLISCTQKEDEEFDFNGFDISQDGATILFSYKKDSLYNIYEKNIKSGKLNQILKDSGNYTSPKFVDETKFVTIFYKPNSLSPIFIFFDSKTKIKINQIQVDNGYIADYTFSDKRDKIYFSQAKEFASYSPIAPKNYHNFEIYELNLKSETITQLTNQKFYYLYEIIDFDKENLVFSSKGNSNESGLFFLNKNNQKISKIIMVNDTLRQSEMYSNPIMWNTNQIISSSSYQLTLLDFKTKKETQILPSHGFHYSQIRRFQNEIYYKLTDKSEKIFKYNFYTKRIDTINLIN